MNPTQARLDKVGGKLVCDQLNVVESSPAFLGCLNIGLGCKWAWAGPNMIVTPDWA